MAAGRRIPAWTGTGDASRNDLERVALCQPLRSSCSVLLSELLLPASITKHNYVYTYKIYVKYKAFSECIGLCLSLISSEVLWAYLYSSL